jgi:hypothetical protein
MARKQAAAAISTDVQEPDLSVMNAQAEGEAAVEVLQIMAPQAAATQESQTDGAKSQTDLVDRIEVSASSLEYVFSELEDKHKMLEVLPQTTKAIFQLVKMRYTNPSNDQSQNLTKFVSRAGTLVRDGKQAYLFSALMKPTSPQQGIISHDTERDLDLSTYCYHPETSHDRMNHAYVSVSDLETFFGYNGNY